MLIGIIALIALIPGILLGLQWGVWAGLGIFVGGVLLQALAVFLYLLYLSLYLTHH